MLDIIARIFLGFSHETFIIPFVITGYIWVEQRLFYHAICLVLFSILLNYALKVTFLIPLSPRLGLEGFAFPSGHMQTSTVLYGWLMLHMSRRLLKLMLFFILTGIGLSLVHFGYHNFRDISGSIFFAGLVLLAYRKLLTWQPVKSPAFLLIISSLLMLYIHYKYGLKEHLWFGFYGLAGVVTGQLFTNMSIQTSLRCKIYTTGIFLLSFLLLKGLLMAACLMKILSFIRSLQWFFLGLLLPLSSFLAKCFDQHRKET